MKRCPKCQVDNDDDAIKCKNCQYEFKEEINKKDSTDEQKDESNEWPSDEWKDWNLM